MTRVVCALLLAWVAALLLGCVAALSADDILRQEQIEINSQRLESDDAQTPECRQLSRANEWLACGTLVGNGVWSDSGSPCVAEGGIR